MCSMVWREQVFYRIRNCPIRTIHWNLSSAGEGQGYAVLGHSALVFVLAFATAVSASCGGGALTTEFDHPTAERQGLTQYGEVRPDFGIQKCHIVSGGLRE
jgi:hypothetical protein